MDTDELISLDIGCAEKPIGSVNIDIIRHGGEVYKEKQKKDALTNQHKIDNFVLADPEYLPFKDTCFNLVFSRHSIAHVNNPFLMLKEMNRVSKHKVIVRCPHRVGSGAKRSDHRYSFDEKWFETAAKKIGVSITVFTTCIDFPITNRLLFFPQMMQQTLIWGLIRRFERSIIRRGFFKKPLEIEINLHKNRKPISNIPSLYVVVCNNQATYDNCFSKSKGVKSSQVTVYMNKNAVGLPTHYNQFIDKHQHENVWLVFAHQDFILKEPLNLDGLDPLAIYGVIGTRRTPGNLLGQIIQFDGSRLGTKLTSPVPVQVLDEMCLITHSSLFQKGLRFEEKFKFHFYGADLCLQAYSRGFDVYAIQVECQHKSRTAIGDITSKAYIESKRDFKEKWTKYLHIRTTTTVLE